MPTTRYVNDNLSFLPAQQEYVPLCYPELSNLYLQGAASSHSGNSSSESECVTVETFHESSRSPLRSPDTTTSEHVIKGPTLELVEPPVESMKFRYKTEMKGTHGSILGISSHQKGNAKKKLFPSVKLTNYQPVVQGEKVIIRCTLTTADENEALRVPHVHHLKKKERTMETPSKTKDIDDPIDIVVSSPSYLAVFANITILFVKKEEQLEEMIKKKKRHAEKKYSMEILSPSSIIDEKQLMEEAQKELLNMNSNRLNTACLKFEALRAVRGHLDYQPICRPIFSKPIRNIKNAQYNDLQICRIDKVVGSCLGRDEVFIFVNKVNKKDIKVRFYELDENEDEVWHDYADFSEADVHFQFAIAFKTPRYKDVDINNNVQVFFQLERPSTGSFSDPREFEYTPQPKNWQDMVRKRPRRESLQMPAVVPDLSRPPTASSSTSGNAFPRFFSSVSQPPAHAQTLSTSPSSEARQSDSQSIAGFINENSFSNMSEFDQFNLNLDFDFLRDIDMGGEEEAMDICPQTATSISSSHSSVNELLSSFPSGDSDIIKKVIQSEGWDQLASCYDVPANISQQIRSEISGLDVRRSDPCVVDGPLISGFKKPNQKIGSGIPMFQSDTGLGDCSTTLSKSPAYHQGWIEVRSAKEGRRGTKLSRDNIVANVNRAVTKLLKIRDIRKIQEEVVKRCLLTIFETSVGEDQDRVLHVLASDENFPPEILQFLKVLKMYEITEAVLNLRNIEGQTALHIAILRGSLQTISLLVDYGADVNLKDEKFNTAIHMAADRKQNDSLHALSHILEKNPDLSIYNIDGLTPLHLFVKKRKSDIISSLLMKQEDQDYPVDLINQPERKQGNTALHLAVQERYREIVSLLLIFESEIKVDMKNYYGKTPLAYVTDENDKVSIEIRELLLANNADPSLVLTTPDKVLKEPKDEEDENDDDKLEVDQDDDGSPPSYIEEWKSDAEKKLLDIKTISAICPILDQNEDWIKLLKKLEFDEDFVLVLSRKWSPPLYLFKAVANQMPHITPENLRDILFKINPECKKAAQYIDDMILCNMGVF